MGFSSLFASSVPSMPMFFNICEANNKTKEICISWLKPEGGNEIDYYIIAWIVKRDSNYYSDAIPYNGMESNNYTINNLQPGQSVNVSIRANNSAGVGEASYKIFATGKFSNIDCIVKLGGLLPFLCT